MTHPRIETHITRYKDDHTGRMVRRYTTEFLPGIVAQGKLTFAVFECWEDEPETWVKTLRDSQENAEKCLREFATVTWQKS